MAWAHRVNTDNPISPFAYQTKATSYSKDVVERKSSYQKCTQKSSKLDFPGFCECLYLSVAVGFEMFLSEL